jgi:hypothetical protein
MFYSRKINRIRTFSDLQNVIPNCKACKHYRESNNSNKDNKHKCYQFPPIKQQFIQEKEETNSFYLISCEIARQNEQLCGKNGKYFIDDLENQKQNERDDIILFGSTWIGSIFCGCILPSDLFLLYTLLGPIILFSSLFTWGSVIKLCKLSDIPSNIILLKNEVFKKKLISK